jgi:hypothetical protein
MRGRSILIRSSFLFKSVPSSIRTTTAVRQLHALKPPSCHRGATISQAYFPIHGTRLFSVSTIAHKKGASRFGRLVTRRKQSDEFLSKIEAMAGISELSQIKPQDYDYFLVLDFEATCQKDVPLVPQVLIYLHKHNFFFRKIL